MKLKAATFTELTWRDVREQVKVFDPALFKMIEAFNPGPLHTLYKVAYPFGAEIVKNGLLYLPTAEGELVALTDERISKKVREDLNYNHLGNPTTFVLKGAAELYFSHLGNTYPIFGSVNKGNIIGISPVMSENDINLHPPFLWNMTSGARSLFSLAKVSEVVGLTRLEKHFKVTFPKVNEYKDQWELLRTLANAPEFESNWCTELLFFSKSWFNWKDERASLFKTFLYDRVWSATDYWRNQYLWDVIYSMFKQEKTIKVNPAIADIVRQLSLIAAGVQPGFTVVQDNESAPIAQFQKALVDVYKIDYLPVFMSCSLFNFNQPHRTAYYSLEYPVSLTASPSNKKGSTKIADLLEIKYLLTKYLSFLKTGKLNIEGSCFYKVPSMVDFSFFHNMSNSKENIDGIEAIFKQDINFAKANLLAENTQLNFPINSNFLNGCIRLSTKS